MRAATKPAYRIRPHANAEAHARLMERWSKMTSAEIFQTIVDAGIYTPDGELAEPYRTPEPSPASPPPKKPRSKRPARTK
jgi:hypothetical protein